MKIVFIGTVKFSKKVLNKLTKSDVEIVGVCTKKESSFNSDFSNLVPICQKNNIPYKYVEDINSRENINWIKDLAPDVIFCFGWSSLIKKELLSLAPMGIIGFHPAELPYNRGRHPIIWALALGLKQTASTFFFMDEGADSGDILSQRVFEITDIDDAKSVYKKVIELALEQIEEFIPLLKEKSYKRIKQNNKVANTWRKRNKNDGKIDFRMSGRAIYNLVRALTYPYVGAHIEHKGKDIVIWKVKVVENTDNNIECGKVLFVDKDKIVVKTYDGAIAILEHEFDELPTLGEYI